MLALVSMLLVSQVAANGIKTALDAGSMLKRTAEEYSSITRFAEPIERRQNATGTMMAGMSTLDWNATTEAACVASLTMLNGVATNPSGMAVCYNLPSLDNNTGVFMADLRLFMIAAPTGSFAKIQSNNVQVGLSYTGATVSPVDPKTMQKRDDSTPTSLISWPRNAKRAAEPQLIQLYSFVGQINKELLVKPMETDALQKVLIPTVTLSGKDATGATVDTSLSSDEINFVSGIFAAKLVPTKAQLEPPIQTLVVAPDAPFVVPGTAFLIFPIGLVITGLWTILFLVTIGYGTIGRIAYRDEYRRQSARAGKGSLPRI